MSRLRHDTVKDIWSILTHADIWSILSIFLEIQDIGKLDMAITASEEKRDCYYCFLNVLKNSTPVLSNVWNNENTNILFGRFYHQFLVWLSTREIKMNHFVLPLGSMIYTEDKPYSMPELAILSIIEILKHNKNNITNLYFANKNERDYYCGDEERLLITAFVRYCGADLLLFDINKFDTRSEFYANFIEFNNRDIDCITAGKCLKLEYLSLANSRIEETAMHNFLIKCKCLRTLNLSSAQNITGKTIRIITDHCQKLESLDISNNQDNCMISNKTIIEMSRKLTNLRILSMAGPVPSSSCIQDEAIISIAENCN